MGKNEISFNLNQDLDEIVQLIWQYMDQKYIGTLKENLVGYRKDCETNLCKEGQLLQALIPFMPKEQKLLQFMVDIMVYNDIIEKNFINHQAVSSLYRDENKDKEQLKKLAYKLIIFKLLSEVEKKAH